MNTGGVVPRGSSASRSPTCAIRLLVVAVQGVQRAFELVREARRAVDARLSRRPSSAGRRGCAARGRGTSGRAWSIASSRPARAGSSRCPTRSRRSARSRDTTQREERALGVAGAAEEERRRRQVVDDLDADLACDGLQAGQPDARLLVALLGLLPLVAARASPRSLGRRGGGSSGGPRRSARRSAFACPSSRQTRRTISSGVSANGLVLAARSGSPSSASTRPVSRSWNAWKLVITIARRAEALELLRAGRCRAPVVVVRVVGQQHPQAVADRDAGRDDEEGVARSARPAGSPAC